ncbi:MULTISPECIES: TadE/TadG family type IV pilus assembly protein [unclassified Variovorax]|uniref:TadE/TadG family type IV pilus assembly protein n=1 Tax=unclassified Variovorax TaxID=663243 RepID=UPI003F4821EA
MKTDRFKWGSNVRQRRQRGVAAIEFAVVFSVLFLGVYGLITFCGVLYVQQVVSRAAEDGARAVQLANNNTAPADLQKNIQTAVYRSLALSMITPASAGSASSSKEAWLRATLIATPPDVDLSPGLVTVKVTYPYRANPVLPPLPLTGSWMPDRLSGKATAARPSF